MDSTVRPSSTRFFIGDVRLGVGICWRWPRPAPAADARTVRHGQRQALFFAAGQQAAVLAGVQVQLLLGAAQQVAQQHLASAAHMAPACGLA